MSLSPVARALLVAALAGTPVDAPAQTAAPAGPAPAPSAAAATIETGPATLTLKERLGAK